MSKTNNPNAKVGTQFVGELAERLLKLKKRTGISARRINELIVESYLPDLESGAAKIVIGATGPELVKAA